MNLTKQKLLIEQADKKLLAFKSLSTVIVPENGWVNTIRLALKISLKQLASKLNISSPSLKEWEQREANGNVTLKSLREIGTALNMNLVYGFIPKEESLEKMIEKRAFEMAKEIVNRASQTMKLEGQENSKERIEKAIRIKAQELKEKMPKYLWD